MSYLYSGAAASVVPEFRRKYEEQQRWAFSPEVLEENNILYKMSRYGMPIHKFIHKYERPPEAPVVYRPHNDIEYPSTPRTGRWEVYAQETFTIQPRASFTAVLKFGVLVRRGMVFVSLKQDLKVKRLSLQDGVVSRLLMT